MVDMFTLVIKQRTKGNMTPWKVFGHVVSFRRVKVGMSVKLGAGVKAPADGNS